MLMKFLNKIVACELLVGVIFSMAINNTANADAVNPFVNADAGMQLNQLEEAIARAKLQQELQENKGKKAPVIQDTTKEQKEQHKQQSEIKFQLQQVDTGKSRVLTDAEISKITEPYLHRDIVIQDVYKILDELNTLYAQKGYVTCRAFLEPQTIKNGIIKLTLIEGEVDKTEIKGIKATKENYILQRMHAKPGDVPNIKQMNKDLLLFNANNNLQLNVALKPGSKPNTTDIVIEGKEPQQQQLTVFTDNAGNESTGIYRFGTFWTVNSISGVQDNLTLGVIMSKGTKAFSSNYSLPIGLSGTRLNLGYSTNSVHSVESPVGLPSDYLRGHANSYSVGISQPWITNERTRSQLTLDLNSQNSKNAIYTYTYYQPWQDTTVRDATLGFNMTNYGDSWVAYQRHSLIMGKGYEDLSDKNSHYAIYKMNGFYQKAYRHGQAINFRFEAQRSSMNDLFSARAFFIGGIYTVRGYRENYLGGDSGLDLSLEYQFPLDKERKVNGYFFWDYGALYGESAESNNGDRILTSVGVGIKANLSKNCFANVVLASPLRREFANKEAYVSKARIHFLLSGTF